MLVNLKTAAMDCYHKTYTQTICKEESQDSVVPDTLPDIVSILYTCGPVLIRSKDVSEGRVRIEANVPAKVSFISEEAGKIYGMDVNVPLYVSVEDSSIGEHDFCAVELHLDSLETRILNPRKISVRAEVSFVLSCFRKESVEFPCDVEENICHVNVCTKQVNVSPLLSVAEKTFVLTDEFPVPAEKSDCSAILGQNICLSPLEVKTLGNKVIVKAQAKSCIFYLSEDERADAFDFTTEFSQIAEVETLPESAYVKAYLVPSGVYYSVEGEGDKRIVSMELHAVMQLEVYGSESVRYLADAYSNRYCVDLERETREFCAMEREVSYRDTLRAQFTTSVPAAEILAVCATPKRTKLQGAELLVSVCISMSYKCAQGNLHIEKHNFELAMDSALSAGETLAAETVILGTASASISSEGAEVKLPVEVSAFLQKCSDAELITSISYEECMAVDYCAKPSLTILRASSADELWLLAKENCSTVESIMEANHLEELTAPWEKLILIPKSI